MRSRQTGPETTGGPAARGPSPSLTCLPVIKQPRASGSAESGTGHTGGGGHFFRCLACSPSAQGRLVSQRCLHRPCRDRETNSVCPTQVILER